MSEDDTQQAGVFDQKISPIGSSVPRCYLCLRQFWQRTSGQVGQSGLLYWVHWLVMEVLITKLLLTLTSLESLERAHNKSNNGNLCSERSERRGTHQKVVSFSFWGEMETGYWNGIVDNLGLFVSVTFLSTAECWQSVLAELLRQHYPGWVIRLYTSHHKLSGEAGERLCSLQCDNEL